MIIIQIEKAIEVLGAMGLKATPQRLAIVQVLCGNKTHPTAEEIYEDVRIIFPSISFATVYNTLDVLEKKGFINALAIDSDKRRFDPDTTSHHHFFCKKCHEVTDVEQSVDLSGCSDELIGFEITSSEVDLYGYCPDCRA